MTHLGATPGRAGHQFGEGWHLAVLKQMMNRSLLLYLLLVGFLFACHAEATLSEQLVNRWKMSNIIQDGADVSPQHNPNDNRWIALKANGTFVSDGDPYGRNTGKWTFDENNRELYLDSDAGEGDDSYWIITQQDNALQLQGSRSDFTKRFSMLWHVQH